ncbi:MAG: type IV pili methyl-accepting chemotaxis transducer N-terminal domain-containing protein, partial [Burkholderiales bacterium]|nr:type IV pili methyl-accepting chemotaxis transducer N-terminal domain-containing protein [Burkholderiales bacterium]
MALKLPSLMNKGSTKTVAPSSATAKANPGGKSSGSFLDKLLGRKKNTLAVSSLAQNKEPSAENGPTTGAGGTTGAQTRKIKADVAAAGATKPTKKGGGFKLPLIGNRPIEQQLPILLTIAGLFGALTIGAVFLDAISRSNSSTFSNITSQLQYHSQRLAKSAGLAARGDLASFPQLQDSRDEFQRYLEVLNNGGEAFNTTVPSARVSEELTSRLAELTKRFSDGSNAATAILAAKNDLSELSRNIAQVRAGSEELAELSQDLTGLMQQSGAPPVQVLKVNRLTFLSERLGRGSAEILGGEIIDPTVPFLMGKDTNDFRELVKALESGSDALGISALRDGDAKAKVAKLRESFNGFEQNIKPILGSVQKLVSARQSGRVLQQGSEQLLSNVEQLQNALAVEKQNISLILAVVLGLFALIFLGMIAAVFLSDARKRAAESEAENKRIQE